MSLRVRTSKIESDILVLRLYGSVTTDSESHELESRIHRLLRRGEKRLIFDLAGVDQIDAGGGLLLVRCFLTICGSGGEVRFAAASADVVRSVHRTMLDSLLPFDATVAASREYFTRGAGTDA
jgi:anti-anti-sigma factor